jgi:hypothetical protein
MHTNLRRANVLGEMAVADSPQYFAGQTWAPTKRTIMPEFIVFVAE